MRILFAAMVGSAIGILCSIIFGLSTFLDRLPVAMFVTMYFLYLMGFQNNIGMITSGQFSSLFVQIVPIWWDDLHLNESNHHIWLSTFTVRVVALTTGAVCATLVNVIVSGPFFNRIIVYRMKFLNQITFQFLHPLVQDPYNPGIRSQFSMLLTSLYDVDSARQDIVSGKFINEELVNNSKSRALCLARLVSLVEFIGVEAIHKTLSADDVQVLGNLIQTVSTDSFPALPLQLPPHLKHFGQIFTEVHVELKGQAPEPTDTAPAASENELSKLSLSEA